MDSLWKTDVFSQYDIKVFKCQGNNGQQSNCTAIHAQSDGLREPDWLHISERRTEHEWGAWFNEIAASPVSSECDSINIVLCPRNNHREHSAILNYLPFSSDSFRLIRDGLKIHRSLAVLVGRGIPAISRIPRSSNSVVYTLRTQHNMTGHLALTINYCKEMQYKPPTEKTHAVLLGCSDEDAQIVCQKLKEAYETAFSPFTLIKVFLELEMRRRFRAVDLTVSEALRTAEQMPTGWNMSGRASGQRYPKSSVESYTDAFRLKTALEAWKTQLFKLMRYAGKDFSDGIHATDIDPREYLEQLIYEYDIKIAHCERVLQITSLTFQMQTTDLTRRDGREMRAISLLTMVFLPATFVASLMAVPTFDFHAVTSIPQWSIYLVLFLPLTVVVLAAYFIWHRCLETRDVDLSEAASTV